MKYTTKQVPAKKILDTIELNIVDLKKEYETIEDDLAIVSEMLNKTLSIKHCFLSDDLTVDEFDVELENFCKYSINESVKSDNVYIIDKFREFVYIVENEINA
jgi:hypothetical protein|tara:strand:+ start:1504 stop:1812 length:309 start_codon:yes stop_codon:yes gene_type:complete